jgi:predicted transcriptional regulator YheO
MKISNIIKENSIIKSETFNSLSPLMKEAVKDMFKLIENKGNLILNVENAVDKIAKFHNINKKELYQYIEKETNEQLGVN